MFFKYAVINNRYFSTHIVLAEIVFTGVSVLFGYQIAMIFTFALAIAWEAYRFTTKEWLDYKLLPEDMKRLGIIPESIDDLKWRKKRYWLDALGDVMAAFIGMVLVMGVAYVLP